MMTFFAILFVLAGVNALMIIFSLNDVNQRTKKTKSTNTYKIYPADLIAPKYKKAV